MSWRLIIIPLLAVNLLYACTGHYTGNVKTKGIYYRVKSGDTLWSIANVYNIDIQELAEANNITDPKLIVTDTVLFIPDADQIIDDVMSAVGDMGSAKKIAKKEGKTSDLRPRKEERPGDKVPARPEILSMKDVSKGKDGVAAREELKGTKTKTAEQGSTLTERVSPREETGRTVEQQGKEKDSRGESAKIKFDKERPGDKVPARPEILSMRDVSKGKDGVAAREELKGTKTKTAEEGSTLTERVSPREETGRTVEQKAKEKDSGGESAKIKFDKERFIWPVKGKVRSKFGKQPNDMYYNGITIAAKDGAPVLAAASGTVIFSDAPKCCGETIVIKHEDNFATVYYNLGNRTVHVDDKVRKGSRIAFVGKTEKKGEASLNFEIRHKNKARNPLFFLP